ncbi:heat shock factor-binding protein 1-like isoform X5 [Ananas comosus]|uniref:Heat shock factor-binding protein 1-like isoform X5 n=1 Tax=Ananas comosus TaxID=4615 RepID=A0A6P5EX87_ANACO|nr:heat shock factor-binding protein 1-like isoform X5 [Ananas comosus]
MASTDPSAPKVQNLLMQMQTRFQAMSESIISKIDEMGSRIDELEKSINDLKAEMETESGPKFQELHCNTGIVHGPSGILA